jgi:glycosyltransferase involved in cell wall biosynthesis
MIQKGERLKIDFVIGQKAKEIFGRQRVVCEVYKRLKSKIDRRVIDYELTFKNPIWTGFGDYIYYPYKVFLRRRKNSITHICSQELAYLLNQIKFDNVVVTCFDIIPYVRDEYPHLKPILKRMYLYSLKGMMRANKIITISEYSKRDIIRCLGYPEDKIDVIYPGVDNNKYYLNQNVNILEKYGLRKNGKYVLYVGSEQPRKNVDVLIKAFYQLKKRFNDVKLIKVGRSQLTRERSNIKKIVREMSLQSDVVMLDYVVENDMPKIYNIADVLVFPSLYEGFGLPVLEAMACGTPVITSNTTSIPEVVGDAGIMLDPNDIKGFENAMYEVLTNNEIRQEMREKGLKRTKMFTWERCAKETLTIYEKINNDK